MSETPDEQLVRQIQDGNIFVFETLVKRYQRKLYLFVFYMLREDQASQDVVQDSLISLYKTIDRVDTSKKFSAYMFSITRNMTLSYLRRLKKSVSLEKIKEFQEEESLYENFVLTEQNSILSKALSTLSAIHQQVIRLYYFSDLSYEEISKSVHMPVNTVRTHLRRAKEHLRKELLQ